MEDTWKDRGQYIAKKNQLIRQVRFDLSTTEQKIVLFLISKIKPTDTDLEPITLKYKEFLQLCGIDTEHSKNRNNIKNTLKKLADKSCWIKLPDDTETLFRWIEDPIITPRQRSITLRLKAILKPYLLELHSYYTQYQLLYILPLRSKFAIRLYELMKSCESMGSATFPLNKLRELLNLSPETFKTYADFRRYVIELAIREINQHTDLEVTFNPIKKGKKVESIEFQIKAKENLAPTYQTLRETLDGEKPRESDPRESHSETSGAILSSSQAQNTIYKQNQDKIEK